MSVNGNPTVGGFLPTREHMVSPRKNNVVRPQAIDLTGDDDEITTHTTQRSKDPATNRVKAEPRDEENLPDLAGIEAAANVNSEMSTTGSSTPVANAETPSLDAAAINSAPTMQLGQSIFGAVRPAATAVNDEDLTTYRQRQLDQQRKMREVMKARGLFDRFENQNSSLSVPTPTASDGSLAPGGATNSSAHAQHANSVLGHKRKTPNCFIEDDEDLDSSTLGEDGAEPAGRPKQKNKRGRRSESRSIRGTSKASRHPRRRQASPARNHVRGAMTSSLFNDVAVTSNMPSVKTIAQNTTRRADALSQLLSSDADKTRQSRQDAKDLDKACKSFPPQAVGPGNTGVWRFKGMNTELKHHQVLGVAWMRSREKAEPELPLGGILADTMGLGKTVMTLGCIMADRPPQPTNDDERNEYRGTTLIVATRALANQWFTEIETHCLPGRRNWRVPHAGVGTYRIFKDFMKQRRSGDFLRELQRDDIVIATYDEVLGSYPFSYKDKQLGDDDEDQIRTVDDDPVNWKAHYEKNKGLLHRMNFWRIVLDEAHLIRNPQSRRSIACRALEGENRWCLSGTPLINTPCDFWSIFDFIKVPDLSPADTFRQQYSFRVSPEAEEALNKLLSKIMMRRSMVDTLFNCKLVDLPPPRQQTIIVHFNSFERAIYDLVEHRFMKRVKHFVQEGAWKEQMPAVFTMLLRLRQMTAHVMIGYETIMPLLEREDYEELNRLVQREKDKHEAQEQTETRQMVKRVRELLEKQRQLESTDSTVIEAPADGISLQPRDMLTMDMVIENLKSDKQAMIAILDRGCARCRRPPMNGRLTNCEHVYCGDCHDEMQHRAAEEGLVGANCTTCDTVFTDTRALSDLDPAHTSIPVTSGGGMKLRKAQDQAWLTDAHGGMLPSAKLLCIKARVLEWRKEDPETKIIIYTQWIPMVHALEKLCEQEAWSYVKYYGLQGSDSRQRALEKFGTPDASILLATVACGGLGLNLTMASKVILIDHWWNLAVEDQAFSRIYRIGQQKETMLFRMVVKDSIDERMQLIKKDKQDVIDSLMDDSQALKKLTKSQLMALFPTDPHDDENEEGGDEDDGGEGGDGGDERMQMNGGIDGGSEIHTVAGAAGDAEVAGTAQGDGDAGNMFVSIDE